MSEPASLHAAAPSTDGGRRVACAGAVEILTARLRLAPVTAADEPELFALHSDPEAFREDSTDPLTAPAQMTWLLEQWRERWDGGGAGYWTVRLADPVGGDDAAPPPPAPAALSAPPALPALLGIIGLSPLEEKAPGAPLSLYYRLAPAAQGRGFATEAVTALLDHHELGPRGRELLIVTDAANHRSLALAQRLGFDPAPPGRAVPAARPGDVLLVRAPDAAAAPQPGSSGAAPQPGSSAAAREAGR